MSQTFVRNFEIESLKKTLEIQQKTVGDVNCVIWDAAIVLSKYVEILCTANELNFKGKKVIELGAGLGCAGIVASCFGADVTMTDLPEVLDNLENNVEHNRPVWEACGGSAQVKALKWGSPGVSEFPQPDIIIGSDCVYYDESVEPLVETMVALSSEDTELIICQEERDSDKQRHSWALFLKLFSKHFDYTKVPLSDQHSLYSDEEILILKGKKKSTVSVSG